MKVQLYTPFDQALRRFGVIGLPPFTRYSRRGPTYSTMVAHGRTQTRQATVSTLVVVGVLGHLGSPLVAMAARFIVQVSDDADYKDAVLDAPRGTLCVVDVYASWCGPCDALNKKITNLYQDNTECAAAAAAAAPPPPASPPAHALPRNPQARHQIRPSAERRHRGARRLPRALEAALPALQGRLGVRADGGRQRVGARARRALEGV